MQIVISLLLSTLAIIVSAYILPGVHIASFATALVVVVVLGAINLFLKPLLVILTLPVNILTLGLFTLVINALLIMLSAWVVPGFRVDSFWWALVMGLLLSIFGGFFNTLKR